MKKKPVFGSIVMLLIFAAFGACLGLAYTPFTVLPYIIELLVALVVVLLVQTVIHELGHLVFGLLSGYGFVSFRIGSLMLVKEGGKLRLKRFSLAGTGGQCLLSPPPLKDGKIPTALYNLGGCIMNLISAAVFLLLRLAVPDFMALRSIFLVLSLGGAALALTNGLPLRLGQVNNDGYNALSSLKSADARASLWKQLQINASIADGNRIKDMPDEWFKAPEKCESSLDASISVFAFSRAVDSMNFDDARLRGEALLNSTPNLLSLHRSLVHSEMIFLELIGENRKEIIGAYRSKEFEKFEKAMRKNISVLRSQYANALLAKGDEVSAAKLLAEFDKNAKTYPYPSEVEGERELLEYIDSVYKCRKITD